MTRLLVDLPLLDELVTEMAVYDERLDVGFAELAARVHSLHADWQGAAAADQLRAQQQLTAVAQRMRIALIQLRATAQTAAANYASACGANRQIWAR